ncbi:hypothetical protein ONZ45_g14813 [Pleurotus djamor]|nr:hypothetical protein ONZ45_g14813 [Pleurotus djamor]
MKLGTHLLSLGLLVAVFASVGQCHPHILSSDGGKSGGGGKAGSGGGGGGAGAKPGAPTSVGGLLKGNEKFAKKIQAANATFIKESAVGQHPSFMFLGCSDSRVSEGTIFNTQPGVIFAGRNVAAQYIEKDDNGNSVLLYAVHHLGVSHIIVMGHYGCGGVAAAITSTMKSEKEAKDSIDRWIWPIRDVYLKSTRPEIVALRTKNSKLKPIPTPDANDEGYRALVEENVKENVKRIVKSKATSGKLEHKVDILGWVYDVATLEISDLDVKQTLGK